MWIVVKYKLNQINLLKENFDKQFEGETKFYQPKIQLQKTIKNKPKIYEKSIISNYLICYNENFSSNFSINRIKYFKGLIDILHGSKKDQKEIIDFINHCRKFEANGFLTQNFFDNILINNEGKFIIGPFSNFIFKIISKRKKDLEILIGGIKASIKKRKADCIYTAV
jgi:predicted CopG family antitoxin